MYQGLGFAAGDAIDYRVLDRVGGKDAVYRFLGIEDCQETHF